jgi:small-conductance mechanosensitive channel
VKELYLSLVELIEDYLNLGRIESEIAASLITFTVALVIGWIVYLVFRRYLSRWAGRTQTKIDDEILRNIRAPVFLLALLLGSFYGLQILSFLEPYSELLQVIFTVAEILIVTLIVVRIVNVLTAWLGERARRKRKVSVHVLFVLRQIIRAVVYIFAFLAILVVFRVDLSGVIVGLGVGGIAIALALQNVLSDVFSAFSIFFDRPFEVGDFIVVGDYSGTVTKIGIKSTRLQLLQGEELVISNRQLTATSLRNFRKLKKRRVVLKIKVAADTPGEKLRKIPSMISRIIEKLERAEFDRAHLVELSDFSLDYEVVYYMKTSDYVKYLDTQQTINLEILDAFSSEGITMPFPTQTIFFGGPNNSQLPSHK